MNDMKNNRSYWIKEYDLYRLFYIIDLPIPEDFFLYKELGEKIRVAMNGKGVMDNATIFATNLELKRMRWKEIWDDK